MNPNNPLLEKLRAGKVLLGVNNSYPAPGIIELMCKGWDFVWIDGQHGQIGYDAAMGQVRAAHLVGVDAVLRVPTHDPGLLGLYADTCPAALMVPMIDTPEQARAVVSATRFPPLGNRSFGGRRPIDLMGRDYHQTVEVAFVAQVETPDAMKNVRAIAETPGVDILLFSPDDMKLRLGIPMSTPPDGEALRPHMEAMAKATRAAGKFAMCVATTASAVKLAVGMGYQLLIGGSEVGFIRALAPEKLKEMREAASGAAAPATPAGDAKAASVYGS